MFKKIYYATVIGNKKNHINYYVTNKVIISCIKTNLFYYFTYDLTLDDSYKIHTKIISKYFVIVINW